MATKYLYGVWNFFLEFGEDLTFLVSDLLYKLKTGDKNMEYSIETLKKMLSESYEQGYNGCCELKDKCIEDIMAKYQSENQDSGMRVWKVEELRNIQEGTKFGHEVLGGGRIATTKQKEKYMQWDNPTLFPSGFNSDEYPWDHRMKKVS